MKINFKPKQFTNAELARMANIASDLGAVTFATVVLPTILGDLSLWPGIFGAVFALLFLFASLYLDKLASYYSLNLCLLLI